MFREAIDKALDKACVYLRYYAYYVVGVPDWGTERFVVSRNVEVAVVVAFVPPCPKFDVYVWVWIVQEKRRGYPNEKDGYWENVRWSSEQEELGRIVHVDERFSPAHGRSVSITSLFPGLPRIPLAMYFLISPITLCVLPFSGWCRSVVSACQYGILSDYEGGLGQSESRRQKLARHFQGRVRCCRILAYSFITLVLLLLLSHRSVRGLRYWRRWSRMVPNVLLMTLATTCSAFEPWPILHTMMKALRRAKEVWSRCRCPWLCHARGASLCFVLSLAVREKARQLVELLNDTAKIREERNKARELRNKYVGIGQEHGSFGSSGIGRGYSGVLPCRG
jgi:hypothetical protein